MSRPPNPESDKGRLGKGSPQKSHLPVSNTKNSRSPIDFQVLSIIRRCAVNAAMAETLAPLVFGIACEVLR